MTNERFVERLNAEAVRLMEELHAATGKPKAAIVVLAGQAMIVQGAGFLAGVCCPDRQDEILARALEFADGVRRGSP